MAGEASADSHAAAVLGELAAARGPLEARGMGGAALEAEGLAVDVHLGGVTAMGGVEVATRLPALLAAFARLVVMARSFRPHAALLTDMPDFNLPLAAALRRLAIPVVGFVAPQLWAWRPGRARLVARRFDRVACIFPFEVAPLRRAGARASYVGHPLLDEPAPDRDAARVALGLAPHRPCLALLPGSRPGERARLLPAMIEAASRLRGRGALEVIVAAAPSLPPPRGLPPWARIVAGGDGLPPGRGALAAADAAVVASGTATLEAALAGVPQVVTYRLAPPSYLVARLLVRGRFVALPNVVLGRRVVPELLQGAATPDLMAGHAERLLAGGDEAAGQLAAYDELRGCLGRKGAARRVAELVSELVG